VGKNFSERENILVGIMRKLVSSILLFALLLIAGCSFRPTTDPDKVINGFLDAMIKGDFKTAAKFVGGEDVKKDMLKAMEAGQDVSLREVILSKSVLSRIKYEIGDKKVEDNKAEVSVKITTLDLPCIANKALTEMLLMGFLEDLSQEEINILFQHYFESAVNDPNAPMTTLNVKIELKKKDNSWVLKLNDELLNALTGNVVKTFGNH